MALLRPPATNVHVVVVVVVVVVREVRFYWLHNNGV